MGVTSSAIHRKSLIIKLPVQRIRGLLNDTIMVMKNNKRYDTQVSEELGNKNNFRINN